MKKRVVYKDYKRVVTRKGSFVIKLANKIKSELSKFSKKILVVGSIRRKDKNPVDIDIVLIPKGKKEKQEIFGLLGKKGKKLQKGEKRAAYGINGVKVEIYFTSLKSWGATVLSYTGPKGNSIGLRKIAKEKGLLLNQYGLFNSKGKFLAGHTEKSIYEALGKKIKPQNLR